MVKLPRIFKKKRFYFFLAFLVFLVFAYDFLELRYSDETMIRRVSKNVHNYKAEIQHYDTLGRHIRYVEVGNDTKPLLIMLHGAPSSSSFWLNYLRDSFLLSHVKILAPDRPGYGYSDYGIPEISVKKQAAAISVILERKRKLHSQIILHGSSYGGTLAVRLAMDYPHLVDGIILQSASTKPGAETIYDITYPTSRPPLSWIIPGPFRVANQEKLSHRIELEKMLPLWKKIVAPVIILHGTEDGLILPSNATFSKEKMINSPLVELIWAEGNGHTLSWTRKNMILESVVKMINRTRKKRTPL